MRSRFERDSVNELILRNVAYRNGPTTEFHILEQNVVNGVIRVKPLERGVGAPGFGQDGSDVAEHDIVDMPAVPAFHPLAGTDP
jgi:hypothetical protein